MKDPVRLLDGGATHAELALLRAGVSEQPSDAAKLSLLAALGISAAVASPAAAAPTEGGASSTLGGMSSKLGLTWLAAVGGSVALGVAVMVYRGTDSVDRGAAERASPAVPTVPPEPAPSSSHATVNAAQPQPAARPASQQSARARPASRSIAREIERLDQVRELIGRGEPRAALAALDRYGAQHPAGVLRQEATLMRIEALASSGDRASAQRLSERFLRENPGSPHARRIRALAGGDADAP